jgi:hypothetical protein
LEADTLLLFKSLVIICLKDFVCKRDGISNLKAMTSTPTDKLKTILLLGFFYFLRMPGFDGLQSQAPFTEWF